jgi:hypothetical protein
LNCKICACCFIGWQLEHSLRPQRAVAAPAGVEIESPFGHDFNDLPCDHLNSRLFEQLAECLKAVQETAADVV